MIKNISRVIVALAVVGFALYLGLAHTAYAPEISTDTASTTSYASVTLDYGNGTIKTYPHIAFTQGQNVFDVLKSVTEKNNISLAYKDYGGGMGMFIESIDGVGQNDHSKWWQFWINGTYSPAGASSVKVHSGDTIKFVFTSEQPGQ